MRNLPIFVFLAVLATSGCSGTPGSGAASPAQTRANARAAVAVAKSTYVLVANGCLIVAQDANSGPVAKACAAALDPAYVLIVAAATAVDTNWTPGAACQLAQGVGLVVNAANALGAGNTPIATTLADAVLLSGALLSSTQCTPAATSSVDAGNAE